MIFRWVHKKTVYGFRTQLWAGSNVVGYACLNSCSKGDNTKAYVGQCQLPGAEGRIYHSNLDELQKAIEARAYKWFEGCLSAQT